MYEEKFKKIVKDTLYNSLDEDLKIFVKDIAFRYKFTFSELKNIIDIIIDINMWEEENIDKFLDIKDKKKFLKEVKKYYEDLKQKDKEYKGSYKSENKINILAKSKENLGFGRCPVASENTRCCNLLTLDAVESCGFDCSYCSIQSFYNQNNIVFDENFKDKLKNLKLDKNRIYHIGTGQSSDSLMWGNKYGVLDALFEFARENENVILEFKTKSNNIKYLLENDIPKNIITTWSLNPDIIIENEEHFTASLDQRIKSAKQIEQKGNLVGFHFHPIIKYKNYLDDYTKIYKRLIDEFDPKYVAMVSFGTLTFIKPVIKKLRERNFKSKILQMPLVKVGTKESYPLDIKIEMFRNSYLAFKPWWKDVYFYLCMEEHSLWKEVFGYEYSSNNQMEEMMNNFYMSKIKSLK